MGQVRRALLRLGRSRAGLERAATVVAATCGVAGYAPGLVGGPAQSVRGDTIDPLRSGSTAIQIGIERAWRDRD